MRLLRYAAGLRMRKLVVLRKLVVFCSIVEQ
jgi:hypothetical protein